MAEPHQTLVVHEEIENGKEDGRRLLKCENPHERPLAMELRNGPLASNEGLRCFVHASERKLIETALMLKFISLLIFAFIPAVPLNHVLKHADLKVLVSPKVEQMISYALLQSLLVKQNIYKGRQMIAK